MQDTPRSYVDSGVRPRLRDDELVQMYEACVAEMPYRSFMVTARRFGVLPTPPPPPVVTSPFHGWPPGPSESHEPVLTRGIPHTS